jgi:hypothetical protein
MLRNGGLHGDSGYAMDSEEMLLGGRLRHRHKQGEKLFQVMNFVSVLALCQSTTAFLQVETLILVVSEPPEKNQYEMWLSDEYVQN